MNTCSIEDCEKPVQCKGYCNLHYRRFKRYGDPLGSAPPSPAQTFLTHVVMAYHGEKCLIWPFATDSAGYAHVRIDGRLVSVSRYVCIKTKGEPPSPTHQAAHTCGKGTSGCVTQDHLVWKTPRANCEDRAVHGTHARGERSGKAKLSAEQVAQIRSLRGTAPQNEVGRQYGVNGSTVWRIWASKRWAA